MSDRLRAFVSIALSAGMMLGAAGVIVLEATVFKPAPRSVLAVASADSSDADGRREANTELVSSLAECNRQLREIGQRLPPAPVTMPVGSAPPEEGGRRGRGPDRGRFTREDWERNARGRHGALSDPTPHRPTVRPEPAGPRAPGADPGGR